MHDPKKKRKVVFLGADAAYMFSFRRTLMQSFQSKGFHVLVVATALPGFDFADHQVPGVEFHHWPISKKAGVDFLADLSATIKLALILGKHRPDILFAHTIKPVMYGLMISALLRVPRRVVMIPGLGYAFDGTGGLKRRLIRALASAGYRIALTSAHTVIFQNADDQRELRRRRILGRTTHSNVVNGSGVDMLRFAGTPAPEGPPTFLMVSRLLKEKGVYEYVSAARVVKQQMPDVKFVLVGAADTNPSAIPQSEIDAWVREGLIEARGHIKDPQAEFAACNVFVLPSYYMEGCPRSNLEAMSSGRAIITTDWVGCRDTVVDGVTGLLVPPRDVGALAAAMLSLARDPDRTREMGKAGRRWCAERFELGKVTRETVAVIEGKTSAAAP